MSRDFAQGFDTRSTKQPCLSSHFTAADWSTRSHFEQESSLITHILQVEKKTVHDVVEILSTI